MKIVVPTHGTVALRISADDVVPPPGLMMRDLIEFVAATYQFSVKPQIPPNVAPFMVQNFVFQSGQMVSGDSKLAIVQLSIIPNGDVVTAATTDIADKILDDFMALLDLTFGFRFADAEKRRVYQSNIVVEFDVEDKFDEFKKVEKILNGAGIRSAPFGIKRLAFGSGDIQQLQAANSIDDIENSDFVIERRAGEPYSRNRFFCSAPVTTAQHLDLLNKIESALG